MGCSQGTTSSSWGSGGLGHCQLYNCLDPSIIKPPSSNGSGLIWSFTQFDPRMQLSLRHTAGLALKVCSRSPSRKISSWKGWCRSRTAQAPLFEVNVVPPWRAVVQTILTEIWNIFWILDDSSWLAFQAAFWLLAIHPLDLPFWEICSTSLCFWDHLDHFTTCGCY